MLNQRAEHAGERAGGGETLNTPILVISAALFIASTTDVIRSIIHDLVTLTVAGTGFILLFVSGYSSLTVGLTLLATTAVLWTGARLVHENVFRQGDAFLIAATTLAAGPYAPLYLFLQIVTGATWVWAADKVLDHLPFAPSTLLAWIPVAALTL